MGVAAAGRRSARGRGHTSLPPEPTGPVLVAEVVAEQRVVARLEHLGATSEARARPLSGLSSLESAGLEALMRARIVREAARGRYYLEKGGLPDDGSGKRVLAGLLFALLTVVTITLAVVGVLAAL